jgi:hypothetical protein
MSNVQVSIKMSPKAAGALYMKSLKQDERIAELEKELKALVSEVKDLGSVSYDQFPDTTSAEKLLKEQVK